MTCPHNDTLTQHRARRRERVVKCEPGICTVLSAGLTLSGYYAGGGELLGKTTC